MTQTARFWWGFGGSLAVEIINVYQFFVASQILFPERYKRIGFYVIRTLLAAVGGGLAVAYEIDKPILAANIGAATPAIIQALAQGYKPSSN